MRLEGKIAIVTGAGRGLGRAIAFAMAREGASVIVNDVDFEAAKGVADEIKALGWESEAIGEDVSKGEEVIQLVNKTLDRFRKIDILVNNAGIIEIAPVAELTEAQWDSVINVNLKGQFLCSQTVGRQMIKQKCGKIINISSIMAHLGAHGQAAYGASKSGVLELTRVLAVEWGKYGINVNAVSPGITMTPLVESIMKENPDYFQGYVERIPLRKMAQPDDIANAVLFLASSESDHITGQEIIVDGGTCILHSGIVSHQEE